MEKLPLCRVCLAGNVRMYAVVNNNLRELYEKLTANPFVTEDSRPMLTCFFCCAKLKQCYQFQRKCLESEKLFAQMMNEDYEPNPLINRETSQFSNVFSTSPIELISILGECAPENIAIKEELPAVREGLDDYVEPKKEPQSDELDLENQGNSFIYVEYVPAQHFECDSEDDKPLMEFKIEVEEHEVSRNNQRASDMQPSESLKLIKEEKAKNSAKMNEDELILRRRKQNADRSRAYRKRKKELDAMPSTSTIQSGEPVSENIVTTKLLHQKQLNAERCRRYRQKCKRLKSGANFNRGTSDSSTSNSRDTSTSREFIVNPEEFQNSSDHPQQFFNHESSPQAPENTTGFMSII